MLKQGSSPLLSSPIANTSSFQTGIWSWGPQLPAEGCDSVLAALTAVVTSSVPSLLTLLQLEGIEFFFHWVDSKTCLFYTRKGGKSYWLWKVLQISHCLTPPFFFLFLFYYYYWKGSMKKCFLLIFHFSWQLQNRFQIGLLKNECIQKFQPPSSCLVPACAFCAFWSGGQKSAESVQCFVTWGGCVGSCCRVAALQDSSSSAWCSPLWNQQLWTQISNNPNERTPIFQRIELCCR